jgi:3-hydroxybutyryl-CoA dehydrogenase
VTERLGIAGTGAVASGLIRLASDHGEVVAWARSERSARAADAAHGGPVQVVTELEALAECTFVVESIVEELEAKRALLRALDAVLAADAVIASTTSSLSIEELGAASRRPVSFAGVHFFNPVEKMQLVELAFPSAASEDTRRRSRELCTALGKTAVEVPDAPGFVVTPLLFPYLFDAVRLLERHSLEPAAIDSCMKLGAGHPMGPLALLDMVGLDVAVSIAQSLGECVPARLEELIADGRLGRKSGAGFYDY